MQSAKYGDLRCGIANLTIGALRVDIILAPLGIEPRVEGLTKLSGTSQPAYRSVTSTSNND